jgi:ABC-type Fe3+ transport system substrate-binding protein
MNYEKAYKDALERAKDVHTYYCDDREQLRKIESIFPELAESEDERIRKSIINVFKGNTSYTPDEEAKKYIEWLEKQGQKPIWKAVDEQNLNAVLSFIDDDCLRRWLKDTMHKKYDKPVAWSEEDSKVIDNCCLLIAAADDSYEKAFKDDCIHYLQNLKQRMEQ